MTKVFIGGSRKIKNLPAVVTARIENVVGNGFTVLLGDASGADKAVQQYLADSNYRQVLVYCSAGKCRNNVGDWEVLNVAVTGKPEGFDFYTAKDEQMARDADFGLMIWDGESNGTLNNVLNLLAEGKKAVVYLSQADTFFNIKQAADLTALLTNCEAATLKKFEEKLSVTHRLQKLQMELVFA